MGIYDNDIKLETNYKIPLPKESKIKVKKEKITFEYYIDIKTENRGFVLNKIYMFVDDIEAGYISISYIPKEHWEYFNGTILKWCIQKNKIILNVPENTNETKYLNDNYNGMNFKKNILLNNSKLINIDYHNIDNLKDEEIIEDYNSLILILEKKYIESYKKYKESHYEKPTIAYSMIYDEFFSIENSFKELTKEEKEDYKSLLTKFGYGSLSKKINKNIDISKLSKFMPKKYIKSFKGKGYSKYLYKYLLNWLDMNGQCLYAGNLNVESGRVWKSLEKSKFYFEKEDKNKNKIKMLVKDKSKIEINQNNNKLEYKVIEGYFKNNENISTNIYR